MLAVTIHEGKNRQVRRMCAQCGLTVKRLRRVREGALELGDLPPGKVAVFDTGRGWGAGSHPLTEKRKAPP